MKARQNVLGLLGFLAVLALIVPTVGADHNAGNDHIWNDTGVNTRLGPSDTSAWNDAGLFTRDAQRITVGWNDVAYNTRPTQNGTLDWSDSGTHAGRLWFYDAAKG